MNQGFNTKGVCIILLKGDLRNRCVIFKYIVLRPSKNFLCISNVYILRKPGTLRVP